MRSRANYELNSDKPSKYFLNLEKKNFVAKTIYRLQNNRGQIIHDPKVILNTQKEFYQELYMCHSQPNLEYIQDIVAPKNNFRHAK